MCILLVHFWMKKGGEVLLWTGLLNAAAQLNSFCFLQHFQRLKHRKSKGSLFITDFSFAVILISQAMITLKILAKMYFLFLTLNPVVEAITRQIL